MRTLVVGIGNSLRGDDGVGPAIAEELCRDAGAGWECVAFCGSGLDLLGLLSGNGWERVVLVDSLSNGQLGEGECARLELPVDADPARPGPSAHYLGVVDSLRLARHLRVALPRDVRFYGVGIAPVDDWREGLNGALAVKVPGIARRIAGDLHAGTGDA